MRNRHTHKAAFFCALAILLSPSCLTAQENFNEELFVQSLNLDEKQEYKPITLKASIEQSFRQNYDEVFRKYEKKLLEYQYDDTKQAFWYPEVTIGLTSASQRVARLRSGSIKDSRTTRHPTGTFSLDLGEYTLFNWGKDYLQYQNDTSTLKRSIDRLDEQKRELRQSIIIAYFNLLAEKNKTNAEKDHLRHASFIYRYNRERISLKKASAQDYYQSRSVYLEAQKSYHAQKLQYDLAHASLAKLLGDPQNTKYVTHEQLDFVKIGMTLNESLDLATKNNPDILTTDVGLKNAERSYEIAKKDNLALPKITMDLGAYQYSFAKDLSKGRYINDAGNSDLEVIATINATWTVFGEGGFLNHRKTNSSLVSKYLALRKYQSAKHQALHFTREYFVQTKSYEQQVEVSNARVLNATKNYDATLENYMNRKTTFANFVHAIDEKRNAAIDLESTKLSHISSKINLAKILGIEDFPGRRFEMHAVKESK